MTDRELMQQALDALESLQAWPETPENFKRFRAVEALRARLAQTVQEPVAWLYPEGLEALQNGKCWTAYPRSHEDCNIPLYIATPPQQQAEPVAWDKPSDNFNEWWNGDYEDPANPFEKDSAAYWAWAGWKAAQRPWVGLTEEEIARTLGIKTHLLAAIRDARAIEAKLKEKNT